MNSFLSSKEGPWSDDFDAQFLQTVKEDFQALLLKSFHEIKTKRTLPNSFSDAAIAVVPNHKNTQ